MRSVSSSIIPYLARTMREALTDKELVQGILAHDNSTLLYLYSNLYGKIEDFVVNNSGSIEEAKDIFQEGVIALYQNIESGRYQLSASTKVSSYLFQICKFQWYSVLRSSHKKTVVSSIDNQDPGVHDSGFDMDIMAWEENKFVRDAIDKLGDNCRRLLISFYYDEKSMKEIADTLGQRTNSVKNAKYRCMQKLKELIKSRPV